MKETIIVFCIIVFILYMLFCMLLTCVARPSDPPEVKARSRFRFEEEPKGFIKFSIILGYVFIISIGLFVIYSMAFSITHF